MILYKLKNTKTGLFSTKGYEFKKLDSFWTNLDDLKFHIKMVSLLHYSEFTKNYFLDLVVIRFEMNELDQLTIDEL